MLVIHLETLTSVKQPYKFQLISTLHNQQFNHVQLTHSRPGHNQPPHSHVPPVNISPKNLLSQSVCHPEIYNPDSVKYDSFFLFRPKLSKFSGDPLEFKNFIHNFKTHIQPGVEDERSQFCLLLQRCTKMVKDRIEHLATNEEHPYTTAKQRLKKDNGTL